MLIFSTDKIKLVRLNEFSEKSKTKFTTAFLDYKK